MPTRQLENVLVEHPAVAEVCVIAVSDAQRGKYSKAFVVLRNYAHCSESDLARFCREQMPGFGEKDEVVVVPGLPKSPMGMVLRGKLVDMHTKGTWPETNTKIA